MRARAPRRTIRTAPAGPAGRTLRRWLMADQTWRVELVFTEDGDQRASGRGARARLPALPRLRAGRAGRPEMQERPGEMRGGRARGGAGALGFLPPAPSFGGRPHRSHGGDARAPARLTRARRPAPATPRACGPSSCAASRAWRPSSGARVRPARRGPRTGRRLPVNSQGALAAPTDPACRRTPMPRPGSGGRVSSCPASSSSTRPRMDTPRRSRGASRACSPAWRGRGRLRRRRRRRP